MITPTELRTYRFHPQGLDPVTVYVEQYTAKASRIIVQCYAQAWTAYWGNYGGGSVEEFICNCHPEYIASNLNWGLNGLMLKRVEKHQYAYLLRIAAAVKEHFLSLQGNKS
ncbi:hypothetical protein ACO0LB_10190 [Undibacterium sp. SXout7W]|uniref:hypothetical protein n=1 Tax=Undibacterium sp. SXout7W TaxID=3413049 RepID=UPI003BF285D3